MWPPNQTVSSRVISGCGVVLVCSGVVIVHSRAVQGGFGMVLRGSRRILGHSKRFCVVLGSSSVFLVGPGWM